MDKLYIVDDDIHTCNVLTKICDPHFRSVESYTQAALFLDKKLNSDDTILLDLMMPDIDGVEVIRQMAKEKNKANLILMSGYDKGVLHSAEGLAFEHGLEVVGNFTKPIQYGELIQLFKSIKSKGAKSTTEVDSVIEKDERQNKPIFKPTTVDILNAIKNSELVLHYQPQVCLSTNTLTGVEALVRWEHPEHGLLYPNTFIPLAEQFHILDALTEEIVNVAIKQIVNWRKQHKSIKVSVNISAQNIKSLSLPEQLNMLMIEHNIDPSMLVLEITESAIMESTTDAIDILTRMRLKGFQLSIDDFGTGYSSLSQLNRIPFTELKIDQSFVSKMVNDSENLAIVETCIMLAHKLNMAVVAEGIEDQETYSLLSKLGCDHAQGYFIARPMAAEQLNDWTFSLIK